MVARDSVSYPTLAVIQHYGPFTEEQERAIWKWSDAIAQQVRGVSPLKIKGWSVDDVYRIQELFDAGRRQQIRFALKLNQGRAYSFCLERAGQAMLDAGVAPPARAAQSGTASCDPLSPSLVSRLFSDDRRG